VTRSFLEGAKAGLILATAECAFRSVLSPLVSRLLTPELLWVILLPFVLYPLVCGMATTALAFIAAPLLRRSRVSEDRRLALLATAVVAIAVPAATWRMLGKATSAGLVAAAAIILVLALASLVSRDTAILNPLTASVLLIGALWSVRELLIELTRSEKLLVMPIALAALAVMLWILHKRPLSFRLGWSGSVVVAVVVIAAVALNSGVRFGAREGPAEKRLPNIVLLSLDTVRADHTSLYGYSRKTTPELERFAAGSTVFLNATASSNFTLPSHTSMFTGLPATVHGNYELATMGILSPDDTTMAQVLAARGYDTYSVVSNAPPLGRAFGLDRGFRYLDARIEDDVRYTPRDALRQYAWHAPLLHCRRADEIEAIASALVERTAHNPHPFFLFVNFMDAHSPYAPPGNYVGRFPGRLPNVPIEPQMDRLMDEMLHGQVQLSPAIRGHLISQYDAAIAFVDHHAGELIRTLRRHGAYDNTLIIITADHGEAFGDKGFIGHGNSVYQDAIHIPLLIKLPRQTSGEVRNEPVALTDLYATVLDAASCRSPHEHFGISLQRPAPATRIVTSEGFTSRRGPLRAIRAAVGSEYKLIIEAQTPHLFDIRNDPNEEHDLAAKAPASVLAPLQSAIAAVAHLTPHNRTGKPLDPETIRRLRALGYLR